MIIFDLNKNLFTVCKKNCSRYQSGHNVKIFENSLQRSPVLEKFQDSGKDLLKV